MFGAKSTSSPTYLSFGPFWTIISYPVGVDCLREQSESKSKQFDKTTISKSLNQQRRIPPPRDGFDSEDFDDAEDVAGEAQPELCPLVLFFWQSWVRSFKSTQVLQIFILKLMMTTLWNVPTSRICASIWKSWFLIPFSSSFLIWCTHLHFLDWFDVSLYQACDSFYFIWLHAYVWWFLIDNLLSMNGLCLLWWMVMFKCMIMDDDYG